MRFFFIISSLIAMSIGLKCYSGITGGEEPSNIDSCHANSTQCIRDIHTLNGTILVVFGCDNPHQYFPLTCTDIPNGQCRNQTLGDIFFNTCCCGTDLCNSSKL